MICRPNCRELQLIVRVRSFFSFPDGGPKTWSQGRTLPALNVDTHNYGLLQLVDFIAEHYLWGSKQRLTLWRELDSESFEIKSDQELLEWFQVNLEKGIAEIVGQMMISRVPCNVHPQNVGATLLLGIEHPQVRKPQM